MFLNYYLVKYRLSFLSNEDYRKLIMILGDETANPVEKIVVAVLIDNKQLATN